MPLRGLGTPARTQSFDQSVALFLDGMFLGKGRMYSSAFFDVERVEVIKGTQSTLLGKNTSLGALSLTSTKPGQEFGGNVQVSREFENGGWAADAGIDIPVSDTFALRLAGHYVDQDGWVENVLTGEDVPADEELGLRATAVYTPTESLALPFTHLLIRLWSLTASGFVRYRDDMVSQINETFPSESMTSLDLNFSLTDTDDAWKVSLIATNVTDELVTDFSGPPAAPVGALFGAPAGDQGITAAAPSALRSIRLQVGYNF